MERRQNVITDNKNYKLILFGDNILYTAYLDGAEVDLEIIKEINSRGLQLVEHKPFLSVVNFKNIFASMTSEAKEFVATNEELNKLKLLEILIINSLPLRILTKGFISFSKPKTKTLIVQKLEDVQTLLNEYGADKNSIDRLQEYLKM